MEHGAPPQGRAVRDRRDDAVRPLGQLTGDAPVVLVDGENVRRSRWPNLTADELVERCSEWARTAGVEAVVVFDGGTPAERAVDERCTVAWSGRESADDWLVRRTGELATQGRRFWVVTSDRALRAAAGPAAERTLGGGAFLGALAGEGDQPS